jgi:4-hydroxy-2-oxoglutarate aldolase
MNLKGMYPPITTPFLDEEIDLEGLARNVSRWMQTGLSGLVVLGSNGEAPLVDDDELEWVVATARQGVPRDRQLIAGTARQSTRATIRATRVAATAGADAVLVQTPHFFKTQMTADALVSYYQAVADASPVPVILYSFAPLTGVQLQPATVRRLAEHPNIVGLKESNGDMAQVADHVTQAPPGFGVLVGAAATLYASLCLGASGGILAVACVVPELCVRLHRAASEGRHQEALELQRRLTPLARSVTTVYGVPGLKAAMDLAGYVGGAPRLPLLPASDSAREAIRSQLVALEELAEAGDTL